MMLPTRPKIAVLLAAYNGIRWIEDQLTSIQAQHGVAVHIFISVDASSDGTEAWCDFYASQHSNVSLLPQGSPCGGAAKNFFRLIRDVDLEHFDFIALSDQDDRWHEDKLQRAVECLGSGQIDAYSSSVEAFWPNGKVQLIDKAQPQVKWDHYFEAAGPGCTYVLGKHFARHLRHQVYTQWEPLQAVTLHDWYIYALARCHGYSWHIDPLPSLAYRQHSDNQVGANVGLAALISRYSTILNGWWFGQVRLIEDLVNQSRPLSSRPDWRCLTRSDLFHLSLQASQCRRSSRDQLLFTVVCMVTAIIGVRVK